MIRWPWQSEPVIALPRIALKGDGLRRAAYKAAQVESKAVAARLPTILPGVVPEGVKSAIAMDSNIIGYSYGDFAGFPGYPYLANLATRAEYRAFASALSTELTREWISLNSSETAGESTKSKVTELTKAINEIGLQQVIQRAAEHDSYFGRGQIFIDIKGHNRALPLILSPKTIKKGSIVKISTVEPIWTTPNAYNAIDPTAPDFYKPSKWWMLGQEVHASRLLSIITRPLPDILKPAYNFSGMSLSQLAEPYVNNWLRTRQSVADLINNFSITALATDMSQILAGVDDGADLQSRVTLFTATRSNQGVVLLDKDREQLVQVNVPLGGLHELQAQAQEHMCAVGRMPAIILTGISPSGLNASSDGEIKTWFDWVAAQQNAFWFYPIDIIIKVLQLSMYGEIDPNISFSFISLYQMTPKELADIRTADSTTASNYIDRGVIDPAEERERLARDPDSGYQGLDLSMTITDTNVEGENDDNEETDTDFTD